MLPPDNRLQEAPEGKGCERVSIKSCGHTRYQTLLSTQELRMTFVTDHISCANVGLARQGAVNSTQIPGAPRNTPFPGNMATASCLAGGLPPPPCTGYLDLGQEGVNGGQVWQAGGDIQEPLGQGLPQLQVLQRPLHALPQLQPRGIAKPSALPFHAERAMEGRHRETREWGQSRPEASTGTPREPVHVIPMVALPHPQAAGSGYGASEVYPSD